MPVDVLKTLLDKLDKMEQEYLAISQQLQDPAICSDPKKLVPLQRQQGKLSHLVSKYREYKQLTDQQQQAQQLATAPETDPELKELAHQESEELLKKADAILDEIKNTLVMADDAAIESVILEIRPGTGGEEAALFARDLYQMYTKYAEKKGWKVEVMDFSPTELGGIREVVLNIQGPGVWSHLGYEGGGHRVQRVPETEAQGRIHTSAATVAVLPEAEEIDVEIKPEDVIEHVSCAGGPGGQNVNKVATAIRLEHIPTGIVVSMRDERSQHKNRAKAYRILRSRVLEYYKSQADAQRAAQRKNMIGSGDRSQRIRTYNFPQNRLTDHRINLSLYSLDKIIAGEMDELIAALQDYDRQQRLANL